MNSTNIPNEEVSRVVVAGIILAANVAVMIFLFGESNFLIPSDINNYIFGFLRYGLLIDSILLYLYITSVGVLLVHDQKFGFLSWANPAKAWYRFFYKRGVEFAFYIFTFSVVSYFSAIFLTKVTDLLVLQINAF